jgi:hypothetical protein
VSCRPGPLRGTSCGIPLRVVLALGANEICANQPTGESCEPKTHDEVVVARAGFCYLLGAGVEDGTAGAGAEAAGVLLSVDGLEEVLSELPLSLVELAAGLAEA